MAQQTKVTGVILAGGQARRMQHRDKGLVPFHGRPMVSYAIAAMAPLVDRGTVNANRNREVYERFGWPVVQDHYGHFDGPLAGILTAMMQSDTDVLLVMPCDSPLIRTEHLRRLLSARAERDAEIAVAFDGERLHPVFLALKTALQVSLREYLESGRRKIEHWLAGHDTVRVDFSDEPDVFLNVNTLSELSDLEQEKGSF